MTGTQAGQVETRHIKTLYVFSWSHSAKVSSFSTLAPGNFLRFNTVVIHKIRNTTSKMQYCLA